MTVTNSFRVSVYTAKRNEKVSASFWKPEIFKFSKSETPILPPFAASETIGLHQTCKPDDYWSTAMLSIGALGTRQGQRLKSLDGSKGSGPVGVDELKKLQEELRLPMRGRVPIAEETNRAHHLRLERLINCTL
jgi:hypothetical protein